MTQRVYSYGSGIPLDQEEIDYLTDADVSTLDAKRFRISDRSLTIVRW